MVAAGAPTGLRLRSCHRGQCRARSVDEGPALVGRLGGADRYPSALLGKQKSHQWYPAGRAPTG